MKKVILLCGVLALLTGCATRYRVLTNTYSSNPAGPAPFEAGDTYAVIGNEKAMNQLFDAEVRSKIEQALVRRGYQIATPGQAKYLVHFLYDVNGRTETVATPAHCSMWISRSRARICPRMRAISFRTQWSFIRD